MKAYEEFGKLGVSEILCKALDQKGYVEPTPIQKLTIPELLNGETDLVAQAQTGTGKTAAFAIPILEQIRHDGKWVQALVLSPTRELCMQTASEFESMKGETGLKIAAVYGGQPIGIQLALLRQGADIVIGTPGRVMDLMERGALRFDRIRIAVLDEADEMLDMGFREDMESILSRTPPEKRTLMFSATMPQEILSIAERFMRDYTKIRAEREKINPTACDQIFYEIRREDKPEAIARILDMNPEMYAMIFCRTRSDVNELADFLMDRGYSADALHGDIAQVQRTRVINNFKAKRFRFLIATDVAARGIDVDGLTHVINYSIPQSSDAYVHRIGRTARAGKTGSAITIITPSEFHSLQRIRRETGAEIKKEQLPNGEEYIESRKNRVAEKIQTVIDSGVQEYLNFASELLTVTDHPAEALAALLKMQYGNGFLDERAVPDLNVKHIPGAAREQVGRREGQSFRKHCFYRFDRKRDSGHDEKAPFERKRRKYSGKPFRSEDFDTSKATAHFHSGKKSKK